jgi:hypothetical protein
MGNELAPIYSHLFAQLEPHTTVHVAVEGRAALDDLMAHLDRAGRPIRPFLQPLIVGREISGWSKDRFAAWRPRRAGPSLLLVPPPPTEATPARVGDWHVPGELAGTCPHRFARLQLPLRFDGGDFAAADSLVLAGPRLLATNPHLAEGGRRSASAVLSKLAGRRVVLLGGREGLLPEHHVNMFALPLGEGRALVGDVRLAVRLLEGQSAARARLRELGAALDLSDECANRFDRAARILETEGLDVTRVPVLASAGPLAYRPCVTYTNAFIEELHSGPAVYLPSYGLPELDAAARDVYRRLGFETRPVPVGRIWLRGGSLDCLVGVLTRTSASRDRR